MLVVLVAMVVVVVHCFGPKQGMLQLCSLHTFQQFMFGMWMAMPIPHLGRPVPLFPAPPLSRSLTLENGAHNNNKDSNNGPCLVGLLWTAAFRAVCNYIFPSG